MIRAADPPPGLRRMGSLSLLAATSLALINLPTDELPLPWLFAFTLPGAVLGLWARGQHAFWWRALLAIAMQTGACYLALLTSGEMTRPAALACTILPPLAFATTRSHDRDPSLALFLGFCVMLVGVILDGLDVLLLLAYGCAAFLSLNTSTLAQSYRGSRVDRQQRALRGRDLSATSSLMLSCLLAVFAIDRTLSLLPSPATTGSNQGVTGSGGMGDDGPRDVGLDDSFRLDGATGTLSMLNGEQLVRAEPIGARALADDLYLRCGFFTRPTLGEWHVGKLTLQPGSQPNGHVLRDAPRGGDTLRMAIERYAGAQQFVFVPQNCLSIQGLSDLQVDVRREWIRPEQPDDRIYEAVYESNPRTGSGQVDPSGRLLGLLAGVPDYDISKLERLMNQWGVAFSAEQAMMAISRGLARHCRYDRREPTGPYQHALENFLFAPDDRHGYCMHFASAAALMLRLRGIPCRIAVGLFGGEPDIDGARVYGSQHAHAWVEVLLRDEGYRIYDPTPPGVRGRGFVPPTDMTDPSSPDVEAERPLLEPLIAGARNFLSQPLLWAIALAATIVWVLLPRRQPRREKAMTRRQASPELRRALQRLLQALAAAGHRRRPGDTLEQFADTLRRADRLPAAVAAAFRAYQESRFGGLPFDTMRKQEMRQGLLAAEQLRHQQGEAQLVAAGQT